MFLNRIFYNLKPLIPRKLQISIRKRLLVQKLKKCRHSWPIDEVGSNAPIGWKGWPDGKRFALVLTHDVENLSGRRKCRKLMEVEMRLGFRSSYNFVPRRYAVPKGLRHDLKRNGFEIGVHGLYHDGKLYNSKKIFQERAIKINHYLKEWGAVGFYSPAMHRKLEWLDILNIEYDQSTFDTDPFEPQPDGVRTIFPFCYYSGRKHKGFVELPYTLPQDHCLFIIMGETNIGIWIKKLKWIARKGGMVLLKTHPDYMGWDESKKNNEQYPVTYYKEFLEYVKEKYEGQYWHALPKEIARYHSFIV